eukprot:scaffold36191_cov26-Tisochrysis_lutea.AAC.2
MLLLASAFLSGGGVGGNGARQGGSQVTVPVLVFQNLRVALPAIEPIPHCPPSERTTRLSLRPAEHAWWARPRPLHVAYKLGLDAEATRKAAGVGELDAAGRSTAFSREPAAAYCSHEA